MKTPPTIKEVAQLAGVTHTTASNNLNGKTNVCNPCVSLACWKLCLASANKVMRDLSDHLHRHGVSRQLVQVLHSECADTPCHSIEGALEVATELIQKHECVLVRLQGDRVALSTKQEHDIVLNRFENGYCTLTINALMWRVSEGMAISIISGLTTPEREVNSL